MAIDYEPGCIRILDQRRLPREEVELRITRSADLALAIRSLAIRGAPALGLAGAYGVALAAHQNAAEAALIAAAAEIRESRPTAVNLGSAVDGALRAALSAADAETAALNFAERLRERGAQAEMAIAQAGASLLQSGARLLTHCHTGALATGAHGTALAAIALAHRQGKVRCVFVDETRPLLQGARLTAWELQRLHVPCALIVDSAPAGLIARGEVDAVLVGADRICRNGDTANKVGTYALALAAARSGVPFYVLAPVSTIDADCAAGGDIPIEQRPPSEVLTVSGQAIAPDGAQAQNPAFDVTPSDLITAIITEDGITRPPYHFEKREENV